MDKRYQIFVSSTYTDLKEERQKLKSQIATEQFCIEDIAELDDIIQIKGNYKYRSGNVYCISDWSIDTSWRELFFAISPYLLENPHDETVKYKLKSYAISKLGNREVIHSEINDQDFQTIKIQLLALNLINIRYSKTTNGSMSLFWYITEKGKILMMQLRTIRKDN